jgi:FkbM family methyltransferase
VDTEDVDALHDEHRSLLLLLKEAVGSGDVFVDVGANVGYFSVELARHVGRYGKVYSFEPGPDVASKLRTNAATAGVAEQLEVFAFALGSVSDAHGGLLRADSRQSADTTKRSLFGTGAIVAEVPIFAFDDLVGEGLISLESGVHAVKIDVEGAELSVLEGMRGMLEATRPAMLVVETIDTHLGQAGSSVNELSDYLVDLDYSPSHLGHQGQRLVFNTVFLDRQQRFKRDPR